MNQLFNREKILKAVKPEHYLLALKRGKNEHSFFDGDGKHFSILHGTHYIEKREDGYYSNYNNNLKKVAELDDAILIKESLFWQLVDFDALPEGVINELKIDSSYNTDPSNIDMQLKKDANAICWLFADVIERDTFKRRFLMA